MIRALAVLSSLLSNSFSIASFDNGTEFFFCFLGGGAAAGADMGTKDGTWEGLVVYSMEMVQNPWVGWMH